MKGPAWGSQQARCHPMSAACRRLLETRMGYLQRYRTPLFSRIQYQLPDKDTNHRYCERPHYTLTCQHHPQKTRIHIKRTNKRIPLSPNSPLLILNPLLKWVLSAGQEFGKGIPFVSTPTCRFSVLYNHETLITSITKRAQSRNYSPIS